jgi:asparagine synthase (glutamine-hydrolysing)
MLFEGFIFSNEHFDRDQYKSRYNEQLILKNGVIGVQSSSVRKANSGNYIGIKFSKYSEPEIVSNSNTQFSGSFVLNDFFESSPDVGAFFDEDQQLITLSRALFGLVPFYYTVVHDKLIAFSTNLHSLLQNNLVKEHLQVNENIVSQYNTFLGNFSRDYTEETFYKGIYAVPPGHRVQISLSKSRVTPNETLRPSKWRYLSNISEIGEEFRHHFFNAIRSSNISNQGTVIASHLSGGLDSSSISAVLKEIYPDNALHTFYDKTNTLDTNENIFALQVADKISSTHHEVIRPGNDFAKIAYQTAIWAQPSSSFLGASLGSALMEIAKSYGCDAIYNGAAGDSIVGSGLELMDKSFDMRDWVLLKDLLEKRVAHYSNSGQHPGWNEYTFKKKQAIVTNNFLFRRLGAKLTQMPPTAFLGLLRELDKHFDISYTYFLRRGGRSLIQKLHRRQLTNLKSILVDDLSESNMKDFNNISYKHLLEGDTTQEQEQSLRYILNSQDMLSADQTYLLSQHYGIINFSPFLDKSLFELCISIPESVKFGDGIGRAHFREAMKGLLPEEVRLRSGKTHVRMSGQELVARMYHDARELINDSTEIWRYIDRSKFNFQIGILQNEKIPYQQKSTTWFHISRTISLCLWLEWFGSMKRN